MVGGDVCRQHSSQPAGRPTLFSDKTRARLYDALRTGAWRKDAAAFAGVSTRSLHEWLARGEKAREAGVEDEWAVFSQTVERIEAEHKILLLGRITAATSTSWQAALSLLERKFPNEYGRREARLVEHTGTVGAEALLGGRQPMQVSHRTRERIIELIEEDERNTIDGTVNDLT